jgi:hypothetical protein
VVNEQSHSGYIPGPLTIQQGVYKYFGFESTLPSQVIDEVNQICNGRTRTSNQRPDISITMNPAYNTWNTPGQPYQLPNGQWHVTQPQNPQSGWCQPFAAYNPTPPGYNNGPDILSGVGCQFLPQQLPYWMNRSRFR